MDEHHEEHTEAIPRNSLPLMLLAFSLVLFGVVVRSVQYLHYRALFHDEAVLASNVLDRSFRELFLPYGDSMAPGLYMALSKVALSLGGINEYAARSVPFIGGLLLLLVFFPVARKLTSQHAAVMALAFLVVSKYLIEFSDFVRPYSTDALVAVLLIALALIADTDKPSWIRSGLFAVLGAVSIWFSYPAVFVLAGIVLVQLVYIPIDRNIAKLTHLVPLWTCWGASFAAFYWFSIRTIHADEDTIFLMTDFYEYANAFMPLPPTSFTDLKWFNFHSIKTFDYPGGLTVPGLAAFAFILGCISMFKRNKKHLAYLLAPIAMALLASGLERYPFWARTILWLTPILYILIGEGIASLRDNLNNPGKVVSAVLLAMLLFVPGVRAIRYIPNPSTHHELNKALDHISENWKEDDILYIRLDDADAFRFCRWKYVFPEEQLLIESKLDLSETEEETFWEQNKTLLKESSRVWFAMAYDFPDHLTPFLEILDADGDRTAEQHFLGASAYQYTFR